MNKQAYTIAILAILLMIILERHGVVAIGTISPPTDFTDFVGWLSYIGIMSLFCIIPCLFCIGVGILLIFVNIILSRITGEYTKKQVGMCLVPYTIFYILFIVLGCAFYVSFIYTTAKLQNVKDQSFGVGNHLISIPKSLNDTTNALYRSLQSPGTSLNEYISTLSDIQNKLAIAHQDSTSISKFADEGPSILGNIDTAFSNIVGSVNSMENDISYGSKSAFVFNTSRFFLSIPSSHRTTLANEESNVVQYVSDVNILKNDLKESNDNATAVMKSYNQDIESHFGLPVNAVRNLLNSMQSIVDTYVGGDIANYELFTTLGIVIFAIFVSIYLLVQVILLAAEYAAIYKQKFKWMKRISICACINFSLFFFFGAIYILIFALTVDVCNEIDNLALTISSTAEFENIKTQVAANMSYEINWIDYSKSIRSCSNEQNYVTELGLDNPALYNISSRLSSFNASFYPYISAFDVNEFLTFSSNIHQVSVNLRPLRDDYPTQVSNLKSEFDADYISYLNTEFSFNDFSVYSAEQSLNVILTTNNQSVVTFPYGNMTLFNASIDFSNFTTTDLVNYNEYFTIIKDANILYNNDSRLVQLGQFYRQIQSNITIIQNEADKVASPLSQLSTFDTQFPSTNQSIFESYNMILNQASTLASESITSQTTAIVNQTEVSCANVGTFFTNIDTMMCSDLKYSSIVTAVIVILLSVVNIPIFISVILIRQRLFFLTELPWAISVIQPFDYQADYKMNNQLMNNLPFNNQEVKKPSFSMEEGEFGDEKQLLSEYTDNSGSNFAGSGSVKDASDEESEDEDETDEDNTGSEMDTEEQESEDESEDEEQ